MDLERYHRKNAERGHAHSFGNREEMDARYVERQHKLANMIEELLEFRKGKNNMTTPATPPVQKSERKRPGKSGMQRVMVSLTDENFKKLEALAKAESPVYPRPVNEYLSVLIEKRFNTHLIVGLEPSKQTELPLEGK